MLKEGSGPRSCNVIVQISNNCQTLCVWAAFYSISEVLQLIYLISLSSLRLFRENGANFGKMSVTGVWSSVL